MRTPRIIILVAFISASLFLLFRAVTASRRTTSSSPYPSETKPRQSVWGLIFYNTPFSLFPPNAAISLTDDNSTTFAARPAAFGPRLMPNGLSGQLWVGSGFAEDSLDANGELGCSDLPGWDGGNTGTVLKQSFQVATQRIDTSHSRSGHPKHGEQPRNAKSRSDAAFGDGTDDHLHKGLGRSLARRDTSASSSHADIQSIQEGAEIKGKIVLLMRGGCGFLEKIMWAQRRGAIAVIVGDNVKGGPLIQMFAHGDDVDDVTVPSVFTARTTAQLLSSLTQPGSFIEDTLDDNGNPVLKVQQGPKHTRTKKKQGSASTKVSPKKTRASVKEKGAVKKKETEVNSPGWFARLFSWGTSSRGVDSESRPPSSGQLDWVMVEDWNDEKDRAISSSMAKTKKPQPKKSQPKKPKVGDDDLVIGVQDWRDPDLIDKPISGSKNEKTAAKNSEQKATSGSKGEALDKNSPNANKLKGGSITPSSGEYKPPKVSDNHKATTSKFQPTGGGSPTKGHGLMSKLFGAQDESDKPEIKTSNSNTDDHDADGPDMDNDPVLPPHEGLWVTITPTSSASPFFDTLLVLVISPLVTLTVVYALLILRARIRRRRWRAPKSVVERLPVRTYHTVARSPSLSPRLPSPSSTSPTTPLLQQSPSPSRSRPRSRTTTGVLESENFLAPSSSVTAPLSVSRVPVQPEKGSAGFSAEWRKYMGRQVECVVCLEEYVDGVSRVMRLPCGHEFHADCITPWLTTRRRTCPICKGDVVRSMARGSWAGPRYEPYRDDGDDEPEAEGSGSRSSNGDSDVEQGAPAAGPSEPRRQDGWLSVLSSSIAGRRRARSQSPSPEDRNR